MPQVKSEAPREAQQRADAKVGLRWPQNCPAMRFVSYARNATKRGGC